MSLVDAYLGVFGDWMLARARAPGGELTEEQEADWAERADDLYWQMSPAEQSDAETAVRAAVSSAAAALGHDALPAVGTSESHDEPPPSRSS